jgi:hypothetical protein
MLFPRFPIRTWILEAHPQAEVDRAVSEHPRIDVEVRGVEWVLVRSPEKGLQVGPDVYLYVNRQRTPQSSLITVLYAFTENDVTVLRMWIR